MIMTLTIKMINNKKTKNINHTLTIINKKKESLLTKKIQTNISINKRRKTNKRKRTKLIANYLNKKKSG